jgi:aspartate-semialdehyde dehydrogenase
LGATGTVGQRFIQLLANHPWFEITTLTASERSAGKPYAEAARWVLDTPCPQRIQRMVVGESRGPLAPRLLFSALDGEVAGPLESELAAAGHLVVTNAKSHRMDPDVPLLIPEVNADHLALVRPGQGGILANPNCSTIGLVLALAPLHRAFGVERVSVVTMQAVSGAGLPGVPSLAILDNIIPFIGGEEDKVENEPRKILGRLVGGGIQAADIAIGAQCMRVPVVDGHTECVSVALSRTVSLAEVRVALESFEGEPQRLGLPSAPKPAVVVLDEVDRPQPRLDRDRGAGMAATVGRLRSCPVFDWRFVVLSHNTVRGAAGGAILVAELAVAKGYLGEV